MILEHSWRGLTWLSTEAYNDSLNLSLPALRSVLGPSLQDTEALESLQKRASKLVKRLENKS